jgi:hypothetical protein
MMMMYDKIINRSSKRAIYVAQSDVWQKNLRSEVNEIYFMHKTSLLKQVIYTPV